MIATVARPRMTTEELLAMPQDGVDRELIRGELREKPMTRRGRPHCRYTFRLCDLFARWYDQQPEPRGDFLAGDQAFRLRRDPDTTVGVDIAYIAADLAASTPEDAFLIDGVPLLAVEILSPSDKQEEIDDKVQEYLAAGVALVWVVNPRFKTVLVYRPDAEPRLFNMQDVLIGDPHLPGLRLPVA